jgi:FKBP-type peptidyl-prolyl cis-trans isomerase FklB
MKLKLKTLTAISIAILSTQAFAAGDNVDISPATAQAVATPAMDKAGQAGQAFLATNKTKPGVVALPDGLQYKVLTPGTGPKPDESDIVTVQYEGKLIDGTVFDSSAAHGGTAEFPLGQVIAGWTEALKLMQKGSVWELYIPSELAYGANGAPPSIGPNETLIFKVTLMDFKKV